MDKRIKAAISLSGALLALALFSGCKSIEAYYRGYISENNGNAVLVDNSSRAGRWQTFDLVLVYETTQVNDRLDISGSISFGNYYRMNSSRIRNLDFYLFFIDDAAKVLETVRISKSIGVQADDVIHFNQSLRIPPAARALSFGYDGESQGDGGGGDETTRGGGGGGVEWFAKLPKKSG